MISRIDHVSIAVNDYEKAFDFFHRVLGAVPGKEGEEGDLKFYYRVFYHLKAPSLRNFLIDANPLLLILILDEIVHPK